MFNHDVIRMYKCVSSLSSAFYPPKIHCRLSILGLIENIIDDAVKEGFESFDKSSRGTEKILRSDKRYPFLSKRCVRFSTSQDEKDKEGRPHQDPMKATLAGIKLHHFDDSQQLNKKTPCKESCAELKYKNDHK